MDRVVPMTENIERSHESRSLVHLDWHHEPIINHNPAVALATFVNAPAESSTHA